MPVFSVTRQNVRHQLARGFNDHIASSGSLANPTTTTFHSPVLVFGALNTLLGAEVSFNAGGGASQAQSARYINAVTPYSAGSPSLYGRVDVLQPWSAAPSTNSGWEIHKLFSRQQYEDVITSAVRKVARRALLPQSETFLGVADTWRYNLTASKSWAFLASLWIQADDATDKWEKIPDEWWFVDTIASPRQLVFVRDFYTPIVGYTYKMLGQSYPSDPAEGGNFTIDPEYVLARAAADLYRGLPVGSSRDAFAVKAAQWEQEAMRLEQRVHTKPYAGSRAVEDI